jgi:hypothetical protein
MIDTIKNRILISWSMIYVVFGSIGTVLNLIVFTRRTRWTLSPSIPYLFASAITAILLIYVPILSRMGIGFQITPFYYISIMCKIQVYLANISVSLWIWFMIGSCWDRYLSSSRNVQIRGRSSIRNSYRTIFIITLCISIVYAQVFYCFEGNLPMATAPCSAKNTSCSVTDTILLFFIQFMAPPVLISYFLIHIHSNLHQMKRQARLQTVATTQQTQVRRRKKRRTDRTILRIILVQVFVSLIFSMPVFAFRVYITLSSTMPKSNVRRSVENLIFNVTLMTFYFEKVCSFYIYTLTSRRFRQILWQFMITIRHRNAIIPQN